MYDIDFYEDIHGKSEVYEYIMALKKTKNKENKQKIKKIDLYIDLLSEYGFMLSEPYIKKIEGEIWELRPLKDRIFFASLNNNKFILLSVFTKKTRKTPKREIEKAKRFLEDYTRRDGNE